VTELIGQGFPSPCQIGVLALVLALGLGFRWAHMAALHQHSAADHRRDVARRRRYRRFASFVVLPFLGLVFGIYLHWLPVAGLEPGSIGTWCCP